MLIGELPPGYDDEQEEQWVFENTQWTNLAVDLYEDNGWPIPSDVNLDDQKYAKNWWLEARGKVLRRYLPMRDTPLIFRRFSNLHHDRTCILEFARTYGTLLSPRNLRGTETLAQWAEAITEVRNSIVCIDALEKDTREALKHAYGIVRPDMVAWQLENHAGWETTSRLRSDLYWELKSRVEAGLQNSQHGVVTEFRAASNSDLTLVTVPQSLLGAIWLQVALLATGQRRSRPCDVCGEWIEIGQGANQANTQYCSNACRCKAYRNRRLASGRR